jgi:hypothetical protein
MNNSHLISVVDNNTLMNSKTATVTSYTSTITTYRLHHKQLEMCGVVMQAINQALN